MPCSLTAVPGSQGPRLSGSVMVAASFGTVGTLMLTASVADADDAESPFSCNKQQKALVSEMKGGYRESERPAAATAAAAKSAKLPR